MARYYEETALIEFVKKYTPTINGETTMECVERAIREAHTADVVPKSEVERLKDKYEIIYQPKGMIETNAKAEVARKIFEEIEAEITAALKNNYARRNECNAETDLSHTANISGKIACLRGLADFVAELKKKYTE